MINTCSVSLIQHLPPQSALGAHDICKYYSEAPNASTPHTHQRESSEAIVRRNASRVVIILDDISFGNFMS